MQKDFTEEPPRAQRSRSNPVSLSSKTRQHFCFSLLLKIKYATSFISMLHSRAFLALSPQHNCNSRGVDPGHHLSSQDSKHPVS